MVTTTKIERGSIQIPDELRKQFGLEEGMLLIVESDERGIHLRPAHPEPEIYTPERKAEFLLSNAMDQADYDWAVAEVRRMGLDPETIPHHRPSR